MTGLENVQNYTGQQIKPKINVTDATGNDITDRVIITYGNNISAVTGKITIIGIPEKGYFGTKTVTFKIYPKWMKWIF